MRHDGPGALAPGPSWSVRSGMIPNVVDINKG
jgi:hypothetical protein